MDILRYKKNLMFEKNICKIAQNKNKLKNGKNNCIQMTNDNLMDATNIRNKQTNISLHNIHRVFNKTMN